ncbi:hypothetical protein AB3K25_09565 [Leuconostoc sp. MS02]|uniref:Uncharacterized protein n=1 Tax=Leuconostoc aquikimchii TaxID=3236804 RepID=A0ABV3S2B0_9LACO
MSYSVLEDNKVVITNLTLEEAEACTLKHASWFSGQERFEIRKEN